MAITTITAAVDMPHGTAAGRVGLFRGASVSRIAMVHGTTHLIIGTGTDNQLTAAFGRPSFSLFFSAPSILLRLALHRWRIRIFRLIGLWFDAKETELRQRADRSRQGK